MIKRFGMDRDYANNVGVPAIVELPDGKYVLHADYLAELASVERMAAAQTVTIAELRGKPTMPADGESARDLIWQLYAALAYQRLADLPWNQALDCAGGLLELGCRKDGDKPTEAVREDLTYWTD